MSQYIVVKVVQNQCVNCSGIHYQGVNLTVFSADLDAAADTLVQSVRCLCGPQDTAERWMGLQETQFDHEQQMLVLCPRIYLVRFQCGKIIECVWAETSLHE